MSKCWRTDFRCQGTWFELANIEHVHFELEVICVKVQISVRFQYDFSTFFISFFCLFRYSIQIFDPDFPSRFSVQIFGPNIRYRFSVQFFGSVFGPDFRFSFSGQIFESLSWTRFSVRFFGPDFQSRFVVRKFGSKKCLYW